VETPFVEGMREASDSCPTGGVLTYVSGSSYLFAKSAQWHGF